MNLMVPLPVWLILLFSGWTLMMNICVAIQARMLRDLFRTYWKDTYGEDLPNGK